LRAINKIKAGEIDAVTFTSSSTVNNFLELLGEQGMDKSVLDSILVYSIGPVTTETLKQAGITPKAQATEYTINGLVDAIVRDRLLSS
jgi:uroporphyrinogen III methyltransferase/synthase